jgi:hypothetical protein
MQILKKTHKKKLDIINPISFHIDQIIESLEPGDIFIQKDLFLYTISKTFLEIKFYLLINSVCVSFIDVDVKNETLKEKYTKEIYQVLLKKEFEANKAELINLKNLITT